MNIAPWYPSPNEKFHITMQADGTARIQLVVVPGKRMLTMCTVEKDGTIHPRTGGRRTLDPHESLLLMEGCAAFVGITSLGFLTPFGQ